MLNKPRFIFISILIFVLAVFVLNWFGLTLVRQFFYTVSAPLERFFNKIGQTTAEIISAPFRMNALVEISQSLNQENLFLKKHLTEWSLTREENEELRKALALGLADKFNLTMVEVLSKDAGQDIILINQGERQGILEGMPLITAENVLVGYVKEVLPGFAKAALISYKGNSFDVEIQNKSILGLVQGEGDLKASLEKAAKEELLKQGDIVITSNLSGKFPRGLLVGEVKQVDKTDAEVFQKAELTLYFKREQLNFLFIITNFANPN